MRSVVRFLAIAAALLWSLMIWAAHGLLGWAGGTLAENAGQTGFSPDAADWISWTARLASDLGQGAAILVWLIGLGAIYLIWLLVGRLLLSRR